MKDYDVIIVGAGFAGSVLAREFAENNKKVLILEKRNHVAGNMYECYDENGIRIHKYGPHIFHTNDVQAFNYLKKFSDWFFYEHRVLGYVDNQMIPIPFNFKSIELLFDKSESEKIKKKLIELFPSEKKVSIFDLMNHQDETIKSFGEYVYEKIFLNYTAKQWGVDASEVDKSVLNRVPVLFGYDDRYFQDEYQYMPKNGYTELFDNILNHPNIDIKLSTDARSIIKIDLENKKILVNNQNYNNILIYTGALDELLDYQFGPLPYRSVELKFENYSMNYYQKSSVVNYPNTEDYTRITEFKYLSNQLKDSTTILKEYPLVYNHQDESSVPYYTVVSDENMQLYEKYLNSVKDIKNFYVCGRLAEYKYYNMDAVILKALDVYKEIVKEKKK